VVAGLVDGLVALGHAVTLYAAGDSTSGSTLRAHYAQAVWPPNPTRELVHAATSVWDILDRREVDLVHVHCPAALAFAPLVPLPMIYTVHHARDEAICELIESVKHAQLTTVAISYRQRALLGCGEATVIHHGLPPARYAFGAGAGGYAVFLGRFSRDKGVAEALDAAARASVPLRLAGRPHPEDASYFRDQLASRLAREGVRWFGEVGPEAKARLLGGAVATLFPATWEEPFGLVMIESMLCGTPVIAFPRGSVAEVVEEGVTGFVVDSVDAMAERVRALVSGAPFDRARCRAVAVSRFGVDRMVAAYAALYAATVARPALAEAR
jgi:glycosyltransferase involved in cell wall biosynthesis